MQPSELNVLRKSLVSILPNLPPSIHSIRIAYFMATDPVGSQYLHKCLTANLPLPLSLATSNALTMLLIQKADVKEINTVGSLKNLKPPKLVRLFFYFCSPHPLFGESRKGGCGIQEAFFSPLHPLSPRF